jgi:TonB family protein
MRRSLLVFALLAGCAHGWIVAKMSPFPLKSLSWTYAEGAVTPAGKLIEAVAVYAPNPTDERLAQADTIRLGKVGTREGVVRFCVTVQGRTRSIETSTTTRDLALDYSLREAVGKWRFKPAILNGRPIEACSTAKFVVTFE